jgi:hypothetical protein
MARPTPEVITALRKTAIALSRNPDYQWGHMGLCNCGFLAQEITRMRKDEIHAIAMQRSGDWSEQLNDYCPTSKLAMDNLISTMVEFGFDTGDLKHLERLSDPKVLRVLPEGDRLPMHNVKSDVIKYLNAFAEMLESEYLERVRLPDLLNTRVEV